MKEICYLTKKVKINSFKKEEQYLAPEEVLSLKLDKVKSIEQYLLFEATTANGKVEFLIFLTKEAKKMNGVDSIKVINSSRSVVTFDENGEKQSKIYNRINLAQHVAYIGTDGTNSFILRKDKKLKDEKRFPVLECTLKKEYKSKVTDDIAFGKDGHVLFHSFCVKPDGEDYTYQNTKGEYSSTSKEDIVKKYNIIRTGY